MKKGVFYAKVDKEVIDTVKRMGIQDVGDKIERFLRLTIESAYDGRRDVVDNLEKTKFSKQYYKNLKGVTK